MKILVVDDSRAMRMIVRRALRQAGRGADEVQEAENGAEALKIALTFNPDLIFCDWNMPVMGGFELLQALNAKGLKFPFGFVSSEATPEVRAQASAAGARFFIIKPFAAEAFEDALKAAENPSLEVHQVKVREGSTAAGRVIPNGQSAADALTGLIGKPVTAMDWRCGPDAGTPTVTATFVVEGKLAFLMVSDLSFAGFAGGALAMLPDMAVKKAFDAKKFPDNLLEVAHEVFNVMARLFTDENGHQPKLDKIYYSPVPLPGDVAALIKAPTAQSHFVVNVPAYGKGRLSALAR